MHVGVIPRTARINDVFYLTYTLAGFVRNDIYTLVNCIVASYLFKLF